MTKEKYLEICFQMDEEPDENKMPPDFEDFPYEVQQAILVYGKLGDRLVPDYGFIGKDYTAVPIFMDVYKIDNREIFLEALSRLDQRMIEKAAEQIKREREKLKSKTK